MRFLLIIFVLILNSCEIEGASYGGASRVNYSELKNIKNNVEEVQDLAFLDEISLRRSAKAPDGRLVFVKNIYISALGQLCKKYSYKGEDRLACKFKNAPFKEVRSF